MLKEQAVLLPQPPLRKKAQSLYFTFKLLFKTCGLLIKVDGIR